MDLYRKMPVSWLTKARWILRREWRMLTSYGVNALFAIAFAAQRWRDRSHRSTGW